LTEKGNGWALTSYTPFAGKISIPDFVEDLSFEEDRLDYFTAKKDGNLKDYKKKINVKMAEARKQFSAVKEANRETWEKILKYKDFATVAVHVLHYYQSPFIPSTVSLFEPQFEIETKSEVNPDYFEKLFENRSFSDVVLLVDQQKIKAHKIILAGKSPFFQDLFLNNESESEFEIKDVDHETMEECISFLYRGKLIDLKKNSLKLYLASEKFGLDELQVIVKSSLKRNVDVENVIETLKFAGQKNLGDVVDMCCCYIDM
jgi:hypothetical protein